MLWDIDLTLVDLRGVGRDWYRQVLRAVSAVELVRMPDFAGRTERAIATDLLALHGLAATDEVLDRMHAELVATAVRERHLWAERGRALPGADAALAALAARADVVQTLVTGNLPEIARHKLAVFGLDRHLDFEIGGYGALSAHRPDLVAAAVAAATAKHGGPFAPAAVVVVGDTPHDVAAALEHGAVAVAVATGRTPAAELRAAGAHTVLTDLSDTEAGVTPTPV